MRLACTCSVFVVTHHNVTHHNGCSPGCCAVFTHSHTDRLAVLHWWCWQANPVVRATQGLQLGCLWWWQAAVWAWGRTIVYSLCLGTIPPHLILQPWSMCVVMRIAWASVLQAVRVRLVQCRSSAVYSTLLHRYIDRLCIRGCQKSTFCRRLWHQWLYSLQQRHIYGLGSRPMFVLEPRPSPPGPGGAVC